MVLNVVLRAPFLVCQQMLSLRKTCCLIWSLSSLCSDLWAKDVTNCGWSFLILMMIAHTAEYFWRKPNWRVEFLKEKLCFRMLVVAFLPRGIYDMSREFKPSITKPYDFSTYEMPMPETLSLLCIGENAEEKARLHIFSSMVPLEFVQLYRWIGLKQQQRQLLVLKRCNLSIKMSLCRWYEWCQGWQGFSAFCASWLVRWSCLFFFWVLAR